MIDVQGVCFGYASRPVLRDVTFQVPRGGLMAVAGPNGVGKTTLVRLLAGLIKPQGGRIVIEGASVGSYTARQLARKVAVVRQDIIPSFAYTVYETVMMGRTCHFGPMGFESEADRRAVAEAMRWTELEGLEQRRLTQLSGGERQRVYIARALAQETPVMLLDEPTSNLDMRHGVRLFELLGRLQREQGKTIMTISHDLNLAARYCDAMLLLGGAGRYEYGSIAEVFRADKIGAAFGVEVMQGRLGEAQVILPVGGGRSSRADGG